MLVKCDGCHAVGERGRTHGAARVRATSDGWVYWRRGVDYCPECAEARRIKRAKETKDGYL